MCIIDGFMSTVERQPGCIVTLEDHDGLFVILAKDYAGWIVHSLDSHTEIQAVELGIKRTVGFINPADILPIFFSRRD